MGYFVFRGLVWLIFGALAWFAVLASITVVVAEEVSGQWHTGAVLMAIPGFLILARWFYRLGQDLVI